MAVVAADAGMTMPTASQTPVKKPELPKAIPEDVKEIVSGWHTIVGDTDNPMRSYLKGAKLSLGGDNRLMVVLEDGLKSDYFTQHPENKEQLEAIIAMQSSQDVEVNIQSVQSRQEFKESYVDLAEIIHMDIEEEE